MRYLLIILSIFIFSCGEGEKEEKNLCGNGVLDSDESCELSEEKDCGEFGDFTGVAVCNDTCSDWDRSNCEKKSECLKDNGGCGNPEYAECVETEESFKCICGDGYLPTSDDKKCVPRIDRNGKYYHGDALLVFNSSSNYRYQAFSGLFSGLAVKNSIPEVSEKTGFRSSVVIPLPDFVTPEMRLQNNDSEVPEVEYNIGDKRVFYKIDWSDWTNYATVEFEATLQYIGEKCMVWAENTNMISEKIAERNGKEFDNNIYQTIADNFYEPSDIDNNGKIFIMFADYQGMVGGYFNPQDLYDMEGSNKADIINIEQNIANYGLNYTAGTVAHEFQHLVHNNRNAVVEGSHDYESWVGEGLSTSAEHVYGGPSHQYISIYNSSDSVRNGLSFFNFDWQDTGADIIDNYAFTYLFHQYFRIQTSGEFNIYREIIEHSENTKGAYDALIKKYIDEDMDLMDFIESFHLAILLNNDDGLYGFKDESAFKSISPSWYYGSGEKINGGGALYIKIDGVYKEDSDKGEDIKYIGVHLNEKAPYTASEYKD